MKNKNLTIIKSKSFYSVYSKKIGFITAFETKKEAKEYIERKERKERKEVNI